MIRALMTYGALGAKARALFGKRLRLADYERLAGMESVDALFGDLQQQPGWSGAMVRLRESSGYLGRVELEDALWEQVYGEYEALDHFVPRGDKLLMEFPVLLAEERAILAALRRLKIGRGSEAEAAFRLLPRGKVDREALRRCSTFDELLAACRGSIYDSPLLRLRVPEQGALPGYTTAETLLRSAYFSHMYRVIDRNYAGETQRVLLRSYGEQIDRLNILHILRLKTYFPGERNCLSVLFPFHYRLSPELTGALCAAPDAAGIFALLKDTPYARSFEDMDVAGVEDSYRRAFYLFNRRQLTEGRPSIYTAVAYLNVKEQELLMLINVVESVKYGVPYDASLARLVGA